MLYMKCRKCHFPGLMDFDERWIVKWRHRPGWWRQGGFCYEEVLVSVHVGDVAVMRRLARHGAGG